MHLKVQYLEQQGKGFFPGAFSDAHSVGDEPSCSSGVRSTQGCHPLYKRRGKKTGISHLCPSPQDKQASQLTPKRPMLYPQGLLLPSGRTAANRLLRRASPSRQEGSSNWRREREQTGKQETPIPWGWENTFGKALEQNEGHLIKEQEPAAHMRAPKHYARWLPGAVWHAAVIWGDRASPSAPASEALCGYGLLAQHWGGTRAPEGAPSMDAPWGPGVTSTGGSSSPLPHMQSEIR